MFSFSQSTGIVILMCGVCIHTCAGGPHLLLGRKLGLPAGAEVRAAGVAAARVHAAAGAGAAGPAGELYVTSCYECRCRVNDTQFEEKRRFVPDQLI